MKNQTEEKSYWAEIRSNYEHDGEPEKERQIKNIITIDAWKTGVDDEEGDVIAQVFMTENEDIGVIYIDNLARGDKYAESMIQEAVERLEAQRTPQTIKLAQLPEDLLKKLELVRFAEEVWELGFACKRYLCEYKGYENIYERNWVWTKVDGDNIYIIVLFDIGNTHCRLNFANLYVKELVDEANRNRLNKPYTIYSKGGKSRGLAYIDEELSCEAEDCNGTQYVVHWEYGEPTVVCGKGLTWVDEYTAKIE